MKKLLLLVSLVLASCSNQMELSRSGLHESRAKVQSEELGIQLSDYQLILQIAADHAKENYPDTMNLVSEYSSMKSDGIGNIRVSWNGIKLDSKFDHIVRKLTVEVLVSDKKVINSSVINKKGFYNNPRGLRLND